MKHNCCGDNDADSNTETLCVLSENFKEAIEALVDESAILQNYWLIYEDSADFEYEWNIPSPYLVFYHFREDIERSTRALSTESRDQIAILSEYIDARFSGTFREAENLFSKGLVTPKYLPFLFRPDQLVVTTEEHQLRAFVQSELMPCSSNNIGELEAFSWEFDGQFKKKKHFFYIDVPKDREETRIDQLSMYPARFAGHDTVRHLCRRGQIFWGCRNGKFLQGKEHGSEKNTGQVSGLNLASSY